MNGMDKIINRMKTMKTQNLEQNLTLNPMPALAMAGLLALLLAATGCSHKPKQANVGRPAMAGRISSNSPANATPPGQPQDSGQEARQRDLEMLRAAGRELRMAQGAGDYERLMAAYEEVIRSGREVLEAAHLGAADKQQLRTELKVHERRQREARERMEAICEQIQQELERAQKVFVNERAADDCRSAKAIQQAQKNKWLNLIGLRDDPEEFVKAMLLLDRVLRDLRVDYALRWAATRQRQDCRTHLGKKGEKLYAQAPAMDGYSSLAGYPVMSKAERLEKQCRLWQQQSEPAEALEASDRQAPEGEGPALARHAKP